MSTVTLISGRDKPIRNRHPWIFSGAIAEIDPEAQNGAVVDVLSSRGQWLARGYLNRRSQIQVRLLTWDQDEAIDEAFWRQRLQRAIAARSALAADPQTNAYRLVHAENDGLPGLIVDRYADWLVLQSLTLGIEQVKPLLVRLLVELLQPQGIVERSDVDVRMKEGLRPATGLLHGQLPAAEGTSQAEAGASSADQESEATEPQQGTGTGARPGEPILVEIMENGYRFLVDLLGGQKTGFYLDQRENRRRVANYCGDARLLNAFAYSGAFAVYALAAGARHVVNVDSSMEALMLAERNLALNGFDPDRQAEGVVGNVFEVLRDWRAAGRQFDLVILDPPKFAHRQAQVDRAARAYKDINLLAFQLLRPGGILVTFSCSGLISADLFQKIVFGASIDAGRDAQIVEWLSQGPDHPVLLSFPEGGYLKGLICRVW